MIQALETTYRGYKMRSRLEARWGTFFDALGVRWEYEKEGYDLGAAGWYLPDFWLPIADYPDYPNAGRWLEVKGQKPTKIEIAKIVALTDATQHTGLLVVGVPGECEVMYNHRQSSKRKLLDYQRQASKRAGHWFRDWGERDGVNWATFVLADLLIGAADWETLVAAVVAAKSARFERQE